jgi:hypothetical protein
MKGDLLTLSHSGAEPVRRHAGQVFSPVLVAHVYERAVPSGGLYQIHADRAHRILAITGGEEPEASVRYACRESLVLV